MSLCSSSFGPWHINPITEKVKFRCGTHFIIIHYLYMQVHASSYIVNIFMRTSPKSIEDMK